MYVTGSEVLSTSFKKSRNVQNQSSVIEESTVFTATERQKQSAKNHAGSTFNFTKSISSLGKIVGEKWHQLKRSSSINLPSFKKESSSVKKCQSNAYGNADSSKKPLTLKTKIRRMKSLHNVVKSFSLTDRSKSCEALDSSDETMEKRSNILDLIVSMEKSISECVLNNLDYEEIEQKKLLLYQSIQDLKRQYEKLDHYLSNPDLITTSRGSSQVKKSAGKNDWMIKESRKYHNFRKNQNNLELQQTKSLDSNKFNLAVRTSSTDSKELNTEKKIQNKRCLLLKPKITSCDSGYDTDSIRTVTNSPDSQPPEKLGDLTDYQGVSLSFSHIPEQGDKMVVTTGIEVEVEVYRENVDTLSAVSELDDTLPVTDDELEIDDHFKLSTSELEFISSQRKCEIIGAITKDGRTISAREMKF